MTFSPRRKSITHGRNTSSRRYSRPLHASRKTRGEIAPSKRNRCESVDSSSVRGTGVHFAVRSFAKKGCVRQENFKGSKLPKRWTRYRVPFQSTRLEGRRPGNNENNSLLQFSFLSYIFILFLFILDLFSSILLTFSFYIYTTITLSTI